MLEEGNLELVVVVKHGDQVNRMLGGGNKLYLLTRGDGFLRLDVELDERIRVEKLSGGGGGGSMRISLVDNVSVMEVDLSRQG